MLRPQKKVSKKELKEDALVTWYVKVTTFYEQYKKNISIAVIAVAVVIGGSLIYLKNRADDDQNAAAQLGQVYQYYDGGQYQAAVDGIPERSIPGLKSIVENFGGSSSGNLARLYLADAYCQLGRYEEALEQFDDMRAGSDLLEVSRLAGVGGCYEALGRYMEAAEAFEKAATIDPKHVAAPDNLSQAARNYGLAGNREKAIELYTRLKKQHPASPYAREAERLIAALSA